MGEDGDRGALVANREDEGRGSDGEHKRDDQSAGAGAGGGAEGAATEPESIEGHQWEARVIVPFGLVPNEAAEGRWGEALRVALVPSRFELTSFSADVDEEENRAQDAADVRNESLGSENRATQRLTMTLPGGLWDAELDGGDAEADDHSALIKTAVRTSRSAGGVDLSHCSLWLKFCELHHDGRTTVVFLCGDGVRIAAEDTPRGVGVATISEIIDGNISGAWQRSSGGERELEPELQASFEARLCVQFLWGLVSRDWAGVVLDSLRIHAALVESQKATDTPGARAPDAGTGAEPTVGTVAQSAPDAAAQSTASAPHRPAANGGARPVTSTGHESPRGGALERVEQSEQASNGEGTRKSSGRKAAKESARGGSDRTEGNMLPVVETLAEVRAAFSLFDIEGEGWVAGDRLEAWLVDAGFRLSVRYLRSLLRSVCGVAEAGKNLLFEYKGRLTLFESREMVEQHGKEHPRDNTSAGAGAAVDGGHDDASSAQAPAATRGASVSAVKESEAAAVGGEVTGEVPHSSVTGDESWPSITGKGTDSATGTQGAAELDRPEVETDSKGGLSSASTAAVKSDSSAMQGVVPTKSLALPTRSIPTAEEQTPDAEQETAAANDRSVATSQRSPSATEEPSPTAEEAAVTARKSITTLKRSASVMARSSSTKEVSVPSRRSASSTTSGQLSPTDTGAAAKRSVTLPKRPATTTTTTTEESGSTESGEVASLRKKPATMLKQRSAVLREERVTTEGDSAMTTLKRPASVMEPAAVTTPKGKSRLTSPKSSRADGRASAGAGAKRSASSAGR